MWVRRQDFLRLVERVKKLETNINGLWATVIAVDKRHSKGDWADNGDLTDVFPDSATRQLYVASIPEPPNQQDSQAERHDTDVNETLLEAGTGRWLLETPP